MTLIDRVEMKGFRVEWNNGNYKVYQYSKEHRAYLFFCYCVDKKELKEVILC